MAFVLDGPRWNMEIYNKIKAKGTHIVILGKCSVTEIEGKLWITVSVRKKLYSDGKGHSFICSTETNALNFMSWSSYLMIQ